MGVRLSDSPGGLLTAREAEVLLLLAQGMSGTVIAGVLGVSEPTVRHHAENLLRKLGVRSRAAAVAEGFRQGLLVVV
jgi:DNA-binding CsgD family transcriptional regulator